MHELTAVIGLVGAVLCVADRLAGPDRGWGPSAVVLVVMVLMACGVCAAALAAGAVAGACLWAALAGSAHGRAQAVVDLATMALLTAGVARLRRTGAPGHPSRMHMADGPGAHDLRFFLFIVTCWVLARACVRLTALLRSASPSAPIPVRPWCRAVLRELGSAAMVTGMAAMLA